MRKYLLPGTGRYLFLPVQRINICVGKYVQSQNFLTRDRKLAWFQFLDRKYQDCSEGGQGYIGLYQPQSSLQAQHKQESLFQ